MSKRRRTPDLVATVTGAQPVEESAPAEPLAERTKPDSPRGTSDAGERARAAEKPTARGTGKKLSSGGRRSDGDAPRWGAEPERSNFTFRLSEEVSDELERLILALRLDHGVRASRSEIAEVALQLVVEDTSERGEKSDLVKRLSGKLRRRYDRDADKPASK